MNEMVEHYSQARCRYGLLLDGVDPDPLHHQRIEIPLIILLVIEHLFHCLVCPCCSTSTCAPLLADLEASRYLSRISGLVCLLGSSFPLRFSKF